MLNGRSDSNKRAPKGQSSTSTQARNEVRRKTTAISGLVGPDPKLQRFNSEVTDLLGTGLTNLASRLRLWLPKFDMLQSKQEKREAVLGFMASMMNEDNNA